LKTWAEPSTAVKAAKLTSNEIASWEYASFQCIVHFLVAYFTLIKMIFLIESSVGKIALNLVIILTILR